MKLSVLLLLALFTIKSVADTNVLELTWSQPPGYQSTLFTATNLAGAWSPISTNPPPFTTVSDKEVAFFYVVVSPTNNNVIRYSFSGSGTPDFAAPSGATYVDTNSAGLWFKISDDSNLGWVQGI